MTLLKLWFVSVVAIPSLSFGIGCPKNSMQDKKSALAIKRLESIQGQYSLGRCEIELHVCNVDEPEVNSDWLGDIYIYEARKKKENFATFLMPQETKNTKSQWTHYTTATNYQMKDRIKDPNYGQLQELKFEVIFHKDGKLRSLHLGTYNTKRDLQHLDDYGFEWSVCL